MAYDRNCFARNLDAINKHGSNGKELRKTPDGESESEREGQREREAERERYREREREKEKERERARERERGTERSIYLSRVWQAAIA